MRKMKDSGLDIVGYIPSEWDFIRLRYLCDITTGDSDTQDADPDGEYPFYVRSPIVERSTKFTFNGEGILMAGDGAGAGRVFHHAFGKYAVHQRVYRLYNFKVNSNFLFYYISNLFPSVMDKGSAQSTVPSVRLPMLLNFEVCFPPLAEQQKIADFLDEKCGEIDSIRSDVQREIGILNDYKKSVITEAVTKGLNPKAILKDSGIEWIGKIPEGWITKKLKYLTNQPLQYGANESGCDYDDSLPRYIRITDISMDNKLKDEGKLSLEYDKAKPYLLEDYDLLFARSGASVGKTFLYKKEYGMSAFAGYLIKASLDKKKVSPKFVYYNTLSCCYESWKQQAFTQATIQNIGAEKYNTFVIPVPPLSEQKAIADYLDEKCSEIDATIADKQKQLETLDEYKKSLIFEYVTGKKEVLQ